jgi:hypothetical protein
VRIARAGLDLAKRDQLGAVLEMTISAPAFEATYSSPEQIEEGLRAEDLPFITELEIRVEQVPRMPGSPRIALSAKKPSRPQTSTRAGNSEEKVVTLSVTGSDRDWVDLAALRMREEVAQGARVTGKVRIMMIVAVGILLLSAVVTTSTLGDKQEGLNAAEIATVVLAGTAGLLLVVMLSLEAITPQLELLPDGGLTRWERLKVRVQAGGRWLSLQAAASAVSVFVGILIGHFLF